MSAYNSALQILVQIIPLIIPIPLKDFYNQ